MAAAKPTRRRTRSTPKTSDHVRQWTVRALHTRALSTSLPKLVHNVLNAAVECIDESIPKSRRNVLREVFDGLRDGAHAAALAGSAAAREVRERSRSVANKIAPNAAKRIQAANDELLAAVRSFARSSSLQVREELDALTARAERTAPKVTAAARNAAKAADGRVIDLAGETAEAGVRVARRTASAAMMTAGGFLEGLAEALSPRSRAPAATRTTKRTKRSASRAGKRKPQTVRAKKQRRAGGRRASRRD
ncbi:MAG: hypothetical protein IT435_19320 [Phycisphaerales bacterium]|nr:hypothetical protein [Phycisphaerales bacterium]